VRDADGNGFQGQERDHVHAVNADLHIGMCQEENQKKCNRCGIEKNYSEFYKHKTAPDGFRYSCKNCINAHQKTYIENNKDKVDASRKKYGLINREKIKKYTNEYTKNNKEKIAQYGKNHYLENRNSKLIKCKAYYQKNRNKKSVQSKIYRENNKEKLKLRAKKSYQKNRNKISIATKIYKQKNRKKLSEKDKIWRDVNRDKINQQRRERKLIDPNFRIQMNIRARIRGALNNKGIVKSLSLISLIGCSVENLKKHIESQFTEDMSWDKIGRKGIHIDHIKPCSSFDLTDLHQQKECFHYTNLQPLWWFDNLKKGSKYHG